MSAEIDTLAREVATRSQILNTVGKEFTTTRDALNETLDKLVGIESSSEFKQQFIVASISLAEKAAAVGNARRILQDSSSALLEAVKSSGRNTITTVDGIQLTLTPTLQFKLPEPDNGEEESKSK